MTDSASLASPASSPDRKRVPGFRAVLIRDARFAALQDIQLATTDPRFDLRELADAAVSLALQLGPQAILDHARAALKQRL